MAQRRPLAEVLREARGLADAIRSTLSQDLDAAAMTHRSKIPFKALTLRELLLHRISALTSPTVSLLEASEIVPAAVLTRSLLETVAVLFGLHRHLNRAVRTLSHESLDKFVVRSLMGSRDPEAKYQATNVVGLVDALNTRIPAFRASYDALSEYTHPNWAGLFGSFGMFDHEALVMRLGTTEQTAGARQVVNILTGTLFLVQDLYNDMVPLLKSLNAQYESGPEA